MTTEQLTTSTTRTAFSTAGTTVSTAGTAVREPHTRSAHAAGGRWTAARDSYRTRRSTRALHQRVERELATYRTPAEIHELDAMLERSGDQGDTVYTQMIERIRLRSL